MQKPPSSCPVPNSTGHVRPCGPSDAKILLVGERPAALEVIKGRPFIGPAGEQLERILRYIRRDRNEFRIANRFECRSPNDWTIGAPWEDFHCGSCELSLETELNNPSVKVVVPLGGTALRRILRLPKARGKDGVKLDSFHGAPLRDSQDRFWIVPTYHPAYLLRGQQRLTKTVCFDLQVACDLAEGNWQYDQPELVIDPPIDWFTKWVDSYLAVQDEVWLDFDVETPDKGKKIDEGELAGEDASYEVLFINLSFDPNQGVTVPWAEPYITQVRRAMASRGIKVAHNRHYDMSRLKRIGIAINGVVYDTMDMFHVLQPTLPRGLGFVAPFYSKTPPYKHLGNTNGTYRAMDGVIGLRVAYGIAKDLQDRGQWDVYYKACHLRDMYSLGPAEEVGLGVNRKGLEKEFIPELEKAIAEAAVVIDRIVPEEVKPLDGPYIRRPEEGEIVEKAEGEIKICKTCGQEKVQARHVCKGWKCSSCGIGRDKKPTKKVLGTARCCGDPQYVRPVPSIVTTPIGSVRFYKKLPFNPDSWQQVLAYIKFRGHKPGTAKKTKKETTDKKTLMRLVKTGDPFYPALLENRQAAKMKGTYGEGILNRLDSNDRVHGHVGHLPWTMRTNSTDPNLQNLADHVKYAADFKKQIVAGPGCRLIEVDFSGIEAVKVGYFSGDPNYIRLAKLGIHGYVESHVLVAEKKIKEPIDLKWSDADIKEAIGDLKKRFDPEYNQSKRVVHGVSYGLTEFGMSDYYPDVFPTRTSARRVMDIFFEVCPKLKPWHSRVCTAAHEKQFLGGPSPSRGETPTARYHEMMMGMFHPYGYRCEFYGVLNYRKDAKGEWKASRGDDAKKAISYFPQSDAAGDLCEAELELFDPESRAYIGDVFFGKTPLRAPIHDSLLLEVPDEKVDEVLEKVVSVMTKPSQFHPMPQEWGMGDFLSVGVGVEVGRNWAPATERNPEGMRKVGVEDLAGDVYYDEDDEEEAV